MTFQPTHSNSWMVLWTESRAEKKVAERIHAVGFENWLPTVTERRRWSDRWKDVVSPLFPGYLFVRAEAAALPTLLRLPGVLTVVRSGDRPARLTDDFVNSLRSALARAGVSATAVREHDYRPGEEVIVHEGPLAGLRGFVKRTPAGRQIVIWLTEIGRGVAFKVATDLVHPAAPRHSSLELTP